MSNKSKEIEDSVNNSMKKAGSMAKIGIRKLTSKKFGRAAAALGKKAIYGAFTILKSLFIKVGLVPFLFLILFMMMIALFYTISLEYKGVDVEYVSNDPQESSEIATKKADMGIGMGETISGYSGKEIDIAIRQFYEDQAKEAAYIVLEKATAKNSKGEPTAWKLDKNFEKPLTLNDEKAAGISDLNGIDTKYRVPVELLYTLDEFLFRGVFRYPEQFVKMVYHDEETYELKQLATKSDGFVATSKEYDKKGKRTENDVKGVWDWGFGSIFVYQEEIQYEKVKGDWVAYDKCVPDPERDTPTSFGWMKLEKTYYEKPIPFDERLHDPDIEEEIGFEETTEDIGKIVTQKEAQGMNVPTQEIEGLVDENGFQIDPAEKYKKQIDEEVYKVTQITTFKGTVKFEYERADVYMRDFESGPIGETTHKYSDKHAIVKGYCTFTVTNISYHKNSDGEMEEVKSYEDHILRELEYKEGGVYQNKPAVKKFINEFGEETIYNPETGEIISQPDPNSLSKEEQEKRKEVPYLDDYAHFFTSYVPDDIVTRNSAYEDMIERIRLATKGRVDEDSVDDELDAENTDFTFYSEGNYTFDPANLTKPSGIKNVAEMKEAITKGCAQKERANPLADNAALILKLEKEQKINALFMIALAKTETNCGRDGVGKSKKNIYSYGGGGQKGYKTYADGINTAIKGLSKNYLTPGGKYNGKPPRATTPHICQLETDRIYCASGCDSWIAGMLHTINRIGSSYSGNVNCSDVAVTGAQTTFANNKVSEMFRELWDILTGKNKEIDESKRKYGRHSNSISDLDIETMLMLTQAMMNRTAVSSQTDLYNLPFWEYGFNPFTDFQGYLNPYERPFDTSDLDITGNFDEMGGVEVSRPYGSVVRAIDDATVKSVGSTFVELALKDGKIVKFEGLMDISLQEGQEVSKGDVIGRVSKGSSVRIFMTSETGEKIDPSFILNPSAGDVGGKRGLIMQMATSLIGKPYVWGAKGPKSFDCSGFVYHVYKTAGITVPGSTVGQRTAGTQIKDIKQLLPGDMVHFNSAQSATGRHVGIFVGIDENGKPIMIHAGSKKTGVVRSDMSWWLKNGLFKYGVRVNELNE